jgi:hypothetical protein
MKVKKFNEDNPVSYLRAHQESGFHVGDEVIVIREPLSYECGWGGHWIKQMNNCIGKKSIITQDNWYNGFEISGGEKYTDKYYQCSIFCFEKY